MDDFLKAIGQLINVVIRNGQINIELKGVSRTPEEKDNFLHLKGWTCVHKIRKVTPCSEKARLI